MNYKKVKLGDVLKYEQPTEYIVKSEDYSPAYNIPVLTAGKSFILGYTNEEEGIYTNLPAIIFDDFTTSTKFVTFPFKVKSSAMKILTADKNVADIRYLFYKLQNIKVLTDQHKRYWISKFSQIEIDLPPLPIQQQIADTLDKAEALHRKDQEMLDKYDELAQAVFYEMFGDPVRNDRGWQCLNGNNYAERISVGVVVKPASYYMESGIMALRSLNVRENYIETENLVFFSKEANETALEKSKLKLGDILIVRTGQPGRSAVVTKEFVGSNCIDLLIVTPKKNLINPDYLSRFFNSSGGRKIVSGNETGQVQKHLNVGVLNKTEIPIPPIEIQNQFSRIIGLINKQKSLVINNTKNSFALQKSSELFL